MNDRGWGRKGKLPHLIIRRFLASSHIFALLSAATSMLVFAKYIFLRLKCQTLMWFCSNLYSVFDLYLSLNFKVVYIFCAEFNLKCTLPRINSCHLLPLSTNLPCVAVPNNDHTIDTLVCSHYPSFVLTGAGTAYVVGLKPWREKNIIVKDFL